MNTSSWPSLSKSPVAAPQGQSVSRPAATAVSVNFPWPRLRYSALPKSSASKSSPCRANIARWTEMRPGASSFTEEARGVLVYRRPLRREEAAMLHLPRDVDCEVGGIHPHPHVRVHVHHEQIEPAVAVVVEHLAPDRSVRRPAERLGGDVLEGAVAGVPIQLTPADHAGHEQVEESILVVVEDGHVAGPPAAPQASAVGDVGEGPVAVVVIKNVGFLGTGEQTADVGFALEVFCRGVEDVGGPIRP